MKEGESMSHRRWKYDVFLSFRGEDTRNGFPLDLYETLESRGINTFLDDRSLERGHSIGPELVTAMEESRSAVVILSSNYATSSWCLDELVKILQCKEDLGQLVIPVFYDADPSDVRHQRGSFQLRSKPQVEVKEHEEVYGENKDKLKEWADALTEVANLAGFDGDNYSNEVKLLEDIVAQLSKFRYTSSSVDKGFIGMDSCVDDLLHNYLYPHQDKDSGDARIIGIHGMRGIGKTSVAQAIHDDICQDFHQSCFLSNVRENSKKDGGLVSLQVKLLSRILMAKIENIDNEYAGATMIKRRLCKLKVLVVIDDVDHPTQLQFLAGSRD